MNVISRVLLLFLAGALLSPAWAHRVVLTSSEVPAKVTSEEKRKETDLRAPKALKDPAEEERRQLLLKQLEELYKQGRPES